MPKDANGLWYPDLWGKQLDVFNCSKRIMLLSGPSLSGKCVDASTIVPCDGRLVRFGSIRGHEHTIVAFNPDTSQFEYRNTSELYADPCTTGKSLTTSSGYELLCSNWHPVWSYCDDRFAFRTSSEIQGLIAVGKKVWVPIKKDFEGWTEFRYKELSFECNRKGKCYNTEYKATLNEDVAYLLGLLCGDGTITPKAVAQNSLGFTSADGSLVESVAMTLHNYFPDGSLRRNGKSEIDWYIRCESLSALIAHLQMASPAHEKRVPDAIIESPKSVVRSFLQGLFDTDGCALKKGYVEYCSASAHLAKTVHQLLLAFGVRSALVFRPNKCRGAWHLYVWGDAATFYREIGFRLQRKQAGQSWLVGQKLFMERSDYPESIRQPLLRLYLSRHDRGAERGNMPRTNKHSEFENSLRRGQISTGKLGRFLEFCCASGDPEISKFYLGGKVFWETIADVKDSPVKLYDFVVPELHSFVANGFLNHNTHVSLHRVIRHMWETPGAQVAMFSKLLKNAKDGGTWKIMHKRILPEWINAKCGLRYTTKSPEGSPGPKVDGQTRTPYFRIRNAFGGESECMLFSLDHDDDIEDKIKEQEFSLIYFSELDKFRDRKILSISLPRLRMAHLRYDQQMWLADTNPSEEGEESWIYETWFRMPKMGYVEYVDYSKKKGQVAMQQDAFDQMRDGLALFQFTPRENPKVDARQLIELESAYAYDQGLYDRYVKGAWIYGQGDSSIHFRNQFKEHVHVLGKATGPDESKWEVINPSPNCFELVTGWDLGDTNHATGIIEKQVINGRLHFSILDELVSIKQEISIEAFTEGVMEIIQEIEQHVGHTLSLARAWSDRSSLEKYSATADTFPHKQVYAASRERVTLEGVPKGPGSVRQRVKLMKQLLAQNRIKVSAHCTYTIRMLKELKKGKSVLNYVLNDENKHIFDALTYALLMECAEELDDLNNLDVGQRNISANQQSAHV